MLHRITTQIGQTATDHGQICKQVREYLSAVSIDPPDGPAPEWDGALLAWAAIKDGIIPPNDAANPMSWLTWGTPMDTPAAGAVAVLTSGSGRHRMTCGVIARTNGLKVYILGAFDGVVGQKVVPVEQVIAVRRPPGASFPVTSQDAPSVPQIVIHNELPQPLQLTPPVSTEQVREFPVATVPPSQAVDAPANVVTREQLEAALSRLLTHAKSEFESVHSRIDQVASHAVATIQIEHAKE